MQEPLFSILPLKSLEIRNFRNLENLRIEKVCRVNLIVGKNNVGKTSLLDAVRLYGSGGSARVLYDLLDRRDELRDVQKSDAQNEKRIALPAWNLFFGRPKLGSAIAPISIGSIEQTDERVRLDIDFYQEVKEPDGLRRLIRIPHEKINGTNDLVPALGVSFRGSKRLIRLDQENSVFRRRYVLREEFDAEEQFPTVYVGSNGLPPRTLGRLWDKITLTELEDSVVESLTIIAPEIQRVTFVGTDNDDRDSFRVILAKLQNNDRPVPLRSMGDGVNRLFGIALALVNARDGFLLVDEAENGIHYSVQADFWRFVFRIAHSLNVQVFCTSHSWDSIRAFQIAANENEGEGVLTRLECRNGRVAASLFEEDELAIATRENIELR